MQRISASGGAPEPLVSPAPGERFQNVALLPGPGRCFLMPFMTIVAIRE